MAHRTQEAFTYIGPFIIKEVVGDTDKQPDVPKAKSERVLSTGELLSPRN